MLEEKIRCTELSVAEWIDVLNNPQMTLPKDLHLLKTLYGFPNHQAAASQLGKKLNPEKNQSRTAFAAPINTQMALYAKRIAQFTAIVDFHFSKRENGDNLYWDFFFKGWDEKSNGKTLFIWQLKPNLIQALETIFPEMVVLPDFPESLPEEIPDDFYHEGIKKKITVNQYERDRRARQACLRHWQTKCAVCGFSFPDMYGEIGEGFIHVHHITPLSEISKSYQVDPIEHLRPVCPNCHAMLHKKSPPYSIEELKEIILQNRTE